MSLTDHPRHPAGVVVAAAGAAVVVVGVRVVVVVGRGADNKNAMRVGGVRDTGGAVEEKMLTSEGLVGVGGAGGGGVVDQGLVLGGGLGGEVVHDNLDLEFLCIL